MLYHCCADKATAAPTWRTVSFPLYLCSVGVCNKEKRTLSDISMHMQCVCVSNNNADIAIDIHTTYTQVICHIGLYVQVVCVSIRSR